MIDRLKAWLGSPGDIAGIVVLAGMASKIAADIFDWALELTRQVGESPALQIGLALLPVVVLGVVLFAFVRRLLARVHRIERAADRLVVRDVTNGLLLAMVARAADCDAIRLEQGIGSVRRSIDSRLDEPKREDAHGVVNQLEEIIAAPAGGEVVD